MATLWFGMPGLAHGQNATIEVTNMIPNEESGETLFDFDPNLAINPPIPTQMASTVNAGNVSGGQPAPIIVSNDNGNTWSTRRIIPTPPGIYAFITSPIALEFSPTTNILYAVMNGLKQGITPPEPAAKMTVFRTSSFSSSALMETLAELNDRDVVSPTQGYTRIPPWLAVSHIDGNDRVYVGYNDHALSSFFGESGQTASIAYSLNGAAAAPVFEKVVIETREEAFGPSNPGVIRSAVASAPNGTIYAAFFGRRLVFTGEHLFDRGELVVVRDDNGGASTNPFTGLEDDADGHPGKRAVFFRHAFTGGGVPQLSITVDPEPDKSNRIYVAWVDSSVPGRLLSATPPPKYALHVRHSLDGGKTWSLDVRSIPNAMNPSIAINGSGEVGLLYQQVVGGPEGDLRCETRVEMTNSAFSQIEGFEVPGGFLLARVPDIFETKVVASEVDETPVEIFAPICSGGSTDLHAGQLTSSFLGVFPAGNTPSLASFPLEGIAADDIDYSVRYQRNHDFDTNTLLDVNGSPGVAGSIDPFFFRLQQDLGLQPQTKLTVRLHTVFADSDDRWSLLIDGDSVLGNADDGSAVTQPLDSGAHAITTAEFGNATIDADFFTGFGTFCRADGNISLDDGEMRTCTVKKIHKDRWREFCDDLHDTCVALGEDPPSLCGQELNQCLAEIGE